MHEEAELSLLVPSFMGLYCPRPLTVNVVSSIYVDGLIIWWLCGTHRGRSMVSKGVLGRTNLGFYTLWDNLCLGTCPTFEIQKSFCGAHSKGPCVHQMWVILQCGSKFRCNNEWGISEETIELRIPHFPYNRDSLLRILYSSRFLSAFRYV